MKNILITIAVVVLMGCGESQESVLFPAAKTVNGTEYSGTYILDVFKNGRTITLELKPDGSFAGKPEDDSDLTLIDNWEENIIIGSWKVEGELLVCQGITERSSEKIGIKFNINTGKLNSYSCDGEEMPINDVIPDGEDGIYIKKN